MHPEHWAKKYVCTSEILVLPCRYVPQPTTIPNIPQFSPREKKPKSFIAEEVTPTPPIHHPSHSLPDGWNYKIMTVYIHTHTYTNRAIFPVQYFCFG